MKQIFLFILVTFFSTIAFSQKRLVVLDTDKGYEVKRVDLTKVFSYRLKNSTVWRNGFVSDLRKDTVQLNNGTFALKNFDMIRQNRKSSGFFNTAGDIFLYGGLSAAGTTLTFFLIEWVNNNEVPHSNNYEYTKAGLVVTAAFGIIGGTLKLVTGKKNIPLGGRFTLVIQ